MGLSHPAPLLSFFIVGCISTCVSSNLISSGCGKQIFTSPSGIVTSPGYPRSFPNHTACAWQIRGSPGSIISITFDDFDVSSERNCSSTGEDSSGCCTNSWFKIGLPEDERPLVLCGRGLSPNQYLSVGPIVFIKFNAIRTTVRSGGRGFKLSYLVIQLRDSDQVPIHCRLNETLCSSTSQECHPKCDHVLNCPSGIDEMGCMKGCQGRVMCDSWNGCYTPDERCNGVAQCGDHSDERNCSPEFCRSDRGGFLCANRQCIRESWQCDQTNDCGDSSDEINCLKNSVITAAVMGSLICGLLLVIAVGCTCKLYALRYGNEIGSSSSAHGTLALSPLERELLQREPPPPYSIALSHPPAAYFQSAAANNTATVTAVHQVATSTGTALPPHQHHHHPPTATGPPTLHHHLLDPYYFTRLCRSSHHRRSRRLRRQRTQTTTSATNPRMIMAAPPSAPPTTHQPSSQPTSCSSVMPSAPEPPPYSEFGALVASGGADKTRVGPAALHGRPATLPRADSAPESSTSSSSSTYSSTATLLSSGGTSSTNLSMDSVPVVFGAETADTDDRPLLGEEQ